MEHPGCPGRLAGAGASIVFWGTCLEMGGTGGPIAQGRVSGACDSCGTLAIQLARAGVSTSGGGPGYAVVALQIGWSSWTELHPYCLNVGNIYDGAHWHL